MYQQNYFSRLSFTMTKWQYHLLAISIFYLVSLPIFVNSQQCPTFDENGECKLKCQCTDEPGKCLRDEQFCDGVFDCQDGQDEEDWFVSLHLLGTKNQKPNFFVLIFVVFYSISEEIINLFMSSA